MTVNTPKKRAIIVHCWDGYPEYCWYPSVSRALEQHGFEVHIPAFPDTKHPQLQAWLPVLQKVIGIPDDETYLIGHSVGCITILRYLESLQEGQVIGGVVFVAGFTDDLGLAPIHSFFEEPIDFELIRKRCSQFVAIHSDNDPYVPVEYGTLLQKKLNAQVIIKKQAYHFSGATDVSPACTELPDVVDAIQRISSAT